MKESELLLIKACEINQGLVTGANKVSAAHIRRYGISAGVGDGIFVLNRDEVKPLDLTSEEIKVLRPWFKNSDIHRWHTRALSSEQVIYLGRQEKSVGSRLEKHLKRFVDILENRREVKNGVIKWWQTQWPRESRIFENEKIVVPYRSKKNTFGYNEIPWYGASDMYFLTQKDKEISLKYILALLNSNLYYLWLSKRGKRKGGTLELFYQPLSEIRIKKVDENSQKPFVEIVDKIMKLAESEDYPDNAEKWAMVKDYESQIDKMVYELYKLTDEEIAIVEKSIK